MTQTESEKKAKELEKTINKLRKDGLIVDVVGQYGIQTMKRFLLKIKNLKNQDKKKWMVQSKQLYK
jgi:biotin operon repressor